MWTLFETIATSFLIVAAMCVGFMFGVFYAEGKQEKKA